MDFGYEEYLKKKTLREKQKESEVPTGIKVTRRRRLEREAAETSEVVRRPCVLRALYWGDLW
jgi:hypothetical protein